MLAVTGDDEDNIVISQLAKEGYGVPKAIARVNDPRNQAHFDALGITQTVCATSGLLGLVEHEVPEHGLVKLLELRGEGLELVELHVPPDAPAAGKRVAGIALPEGAKLVSLMRNGVGEIVRDETVIRPGDQIVAILKPGVGGPPQARRRRLAADSAFGGLRQEHRRAIDRARCRRVGENGRVRSRSRSLVAEGGEA